MTNMRTHHNTTQFRKQLRTRELQVYHGHVGIVIGKGGETIKRLAKAAGDGCRIQHDRKRPGFFVITARTSQACLRAEIKIKEQIKAKTNPTKDTKRRTPQQKPTQKTNSFAVLATQKDTVYTPPQEIDGATLLKKEKEEDLVPAKTKETKAKKKQKQQKTTLQLRFRDDNSIGKRKYNNWLNHHATDDQKQEHAKKQKRFQKKTTPQSSPTSKDFPSFIDAKERKEPQVGVWGTGLDKVKAEPVEEEEVEEPSDMTPLTKGMVKGEQVFRVEVSHIKPRKQQYQEYEEEDAFCPAEEDAPVDFDDEEDWDEEEEDYEDRFADEVDHTLISCA